MRHNLAQAIIERHSGRYDCPVKQHGSSRTVVYRVRDGRGLLHDHAGCSTSDILAALGLTWKDLYPPQNPADRYRRAVRKRRSDEIKELRRKKLIRCCAILRNLDQMIVDAGQALHFAHVNQLDENVAWDALIFAHGWRRKLETDFTALNTQEASCMSS
jgi:hypothetical protein